MDKNDQTQTPEVNSGAQAEQTPPENVGNADSAPEKAEAAPKTEKSFSQEEVNKLISERINAEKKRWEKKSAEDRAEAERVAQMSAEEKAKHEAEKREQEFNERENALVRRERLALAKEKLNELNIPAALVAAVDISSEESIGISAADIAKAFSEAVSAEVSKRLASAPPKKGVVSQTDPFVEGLGG